MEKTKYQLLIFLLLITGSVYAQIFDLESEKEETSRGYDKELANALHTDNVEEVKKILKEHPSYVNLNTDYIYNSQEILKDCPLLFDATKRYLNNECSYDMMETIMNYNPPLYATYDGKTPFYFLLDFLATHKIEECSKAEQLLALFCKHKDFDAGRRQVDFPPPLSYLMIENAKFLNNQFSNDYLSTNVIKTLILNGANSNAYDEKENNLLSFATQRNRTELANFLLEKGTLVNNKNTTGKDAFIMAIESGSLPILEKIYKNGYKFNLETLYKQNAQYSFDKYPKVKDFIYQIADSKGSLDFNESVAFLGLFTQKGDIFIEKHKYIPFVEKNDFSKLINFIRDKDIKVTPENFRTLQLFYLNKSDNVDELWANAQKIKFNLEGGLIKEYWKSEQATNEMKDNLLNNNFLGESCTNKLVVRLEEKMEKYYQSVLNGYRYDKNYKYVHTVALLGNAYYSGKYNFAPNVATFISSFPSKRAEIKEKLGAYIRSVELYYPSHNNTNFWGKEYYPGAKVIAQKYRYALVRMEHFDYFISAYNKAFGLNSNSSRYSQVVDYFQNIRKKIDYFDKLIIAEARGAERRYKQQMCDECVIDGSKTKRPEKSQHFLGTDKSGIIKMKNGREYKWEYSGSGYMMPGLWSSKYFNSFDEMLQYFIEKCKEEHCN